MKPQFLLLLFTLATVLCFADQYHGQDHRTQSAIDRNNRNLYESNKEEVQGQRHHFPQHEEMHHPIPRGQERQQNQLAEEEQPPQVEENPA